MKLSEATRKTFKLSEVSAQPKTIKLSSIKKDEEEKKPFKLFTPKVSAETMTVEKEELPFFLNNKISYSPDTAVPKADTVGQTIPTTEGQGTQFKAFGKGLLKEATYGVGRFAEQAIEKPVFGISALATGAAKETIGRAAGAIGLDKVKEKLDNLYEFYRHPEKYAPVSSIIDPERQRRQIEAEKKSYTSGIINLLGENVADLMVLRGQITAITKGAGVAGSFLSQTGGYKGIQTLKQISKPAIWTFLTRQGDAGERLKSSLYMIANNLTAPIANATGAVGLKATTIDAALNVFIANDIYREAYKQAGSPEEFAKKILPQLVFDIGLAWNTRGLPENQFKADVRKVYATSEIKNELKFDEYYNLIRKTRNDLRGGEAGVWEKEERKAPIETIIGKEQAKEVREGIKSAEPNIDIDKDSFIKTGTEAEAEAKPKPIFPVKGEAETKIGALPETGEFIKTRERTFLTRAKKSFEPEHPVRKYMEADFPRYTPQQTGEIKEAVNKWLDEDIENVSTVEKMLYNGEVPPGKQSAIAIKVAKKLSVIGELERAAKMFEWTDRLVRASGQEAQAVAGEFDKMTGNDWYKSYIEFLGKKADKVSQETKDRIKNDFEIVAKIQDEGLKREELKKAIQGAARTRGFGFKGWHDAITYNNMLSNPQTSGRNSWSNLIQTILTPNIELLAQKDIKGAAKYMGGAFKPKTVKNAFKDAWLAFKEGGLYFKDEASLEKASSEAFRAAQFQQMGKFKSPFLTKTVGWGMKYGLTGWSRFTNAQDKFFGAFIEAGKTNELVEKGWGIEEAGAEAKKMADYYLYRGKLSSDKDNNKIISALEYMGSKVQEAANSDNPIVSGLAYFTAPFIRTGTKVVSMELQASPLGFAKKPIMEEGETQKDFNRRTARWQGKQALAKSGIMVGLLGLGFAVSGNTTTNAPDNKEERKRWFNSGRKEWAFRVGDTWVPMLYTGPYFLSMAIPAIATEVSKQAGKSLNDTLDFKNRMKIMAGTIGKFTQLTTEATTSQTFLMGINTFFQLTLGDNDYNMARALGGMLSRYIPWTGFQRWANTIMDKRYTKVIDLESALKQSIIYMTKDLEAYKGKGGKPSMRGKYDWAVPYQFGKVDIKEEKLLEKLQNKGKNKKSQF